MSLMDSYGLTEASARKRRNTQSVANRQAAFLGQQRGTRKIDDLTKQLKEGFNPKVGQYGERGLQGPGVTSGIARKGLEDYAAGYQKQIGEVEMDLQNENNARVAQESSDQASLDEYIQQLNLQKQRDMVNSAVALQQWSSY